MDLELRGKRAIVTGGTRGIGRAIAERLADEGCHVAVCARDAAQVKATVAALADRGVTAIGDAVDVTADASFRAWIAKAVDALGGLDILVPNVSALGGAVAPDEKSWRLGFEVDVLATVRTVEAALPYLEKSAAASIVAIASTAAVESFGGVRPYNSVKAALVNYMANLAHALAPKRVRVNSVSPGTIYFDGGVWDQRRQHAPEVYKMALSRNPMGRMGTPDEVAKAVVFLASPAASFITGTNLIVDGALTQRVQY
ncbi:MAG: SDR family NAD(P)-dependent oxidoreductase [Alphaproteobacteria bacterium]